MKLMKKLVQATLGGLGYELRKREPAVVGGFPRDPYAAQQYIMREMKVARPVILDVGGNKGQAASRYRARFPEAAIYSFEPFPDSIAELRRRFTGDDRLQVVPMAVGRQAGRATFHVNETDATNSLLPRASGRRYYPKTAGPKTTIEVEVTSLDAFVAARKLPRVDILKFDIQGGELEALRGAETLLQSGQVAAIFSEIMFVAHYEGSPLFHEIWALLARYGFSFVDLYELYRAQNGQLRFGDALFVSREVRTRVMDAFPEEP